MACEALITFLAIENNNLIIHSDPWIKSERDSIRNSCDVLMFRFWKSCHHCHQFSSMTLYVFSTLRLLSSPIYVIISFYLQVAFHWGGALMTHVALLRIASSALLRNSRNEKYYQNWEFYLVNWDTWNMRLRYSRSSYTPSEAEADSLESTLIVWK